MRLLRKVLLIAGGLVLVGALAVACGGDTEAEDGDEAHLRVVTTLPLFADFAEEIGGERVDVFSLFPTGVDPHTYEPAPRDVQRVTEADVVFANGLGLEPAALQVIEANVRGDALLVELAEEAEEAGVEIIDMDEVHLDDDHDHDDHADDHADDDHADDHADDDHADDHAEDDHADDDHADDDHADDDHGHAHDEGDPHLWLDTDNARVYVTIIHDTLAALDPEGADAYSANYEAYLATLEELEDYVEETTAEIPEDRRQLITTHDAFGYLARSLGFEVLAFVTAGPGQEPGPEDVAQIVRAIRDTDVPAVFSEPQIGPESRVLERAADDAGVEVCTLYSDSLDDRVPSYVELMRFNADELVRCLGD